MFYSKNTRVDLTDNFIAVSTSPNWFIGYFWSYRCYKIMHFCLDPTLNKNVFLKIAVVFKKKMIFYKMIPSEINFLEFSNSYDPKYESWRWFPIKGDAKKCCNDVIKAKTDRKLCKLIKFVLFSLKWAKMGYFPRENADWNLILISYFKILFCQSHSISNFQK